MSKAADTKRYTRNLPEPGARLRFTPDQDFSEYLQRFVRPELRDTMARTGLLLYSDQSIEAERTGALMLQHGGTASTVHASIDRELRQRGTSHLTLAKRMQFQPSDRSDASATFRFDIILNRLTAAVVFDHMKVNPDYSVGAHVAIKRSALVGRTAFLAASMDLYERLLDDNSNLGVDQVELVRPLT